MLILAINSLIAITLVITIRFNAELLKLAIRFKVSSFSTIMAHWSPTAHQCPIERRLQTVS